MRIEEKRELAIPAKKLWDYMLDFRQWPLWFAQMDSVDADETWTGDEGDEALVTMKILGRHIKYNVTIHERREYELLHGLCTPQAEVLPELHQYWELDDRGADRMELKLSAETEAPTKFLDKAIDGTLIPTVYRRILVGCLDNLEAMATAGLPE